MLSGSNYTLNGGSSTAIPSSGVLYVSGPATISQTTSLTGKLTIAASGDVAITSSLQLTSQVDDMLSIVSTAGNINIGFSAASRTIEALLLAPSLTAGQGIVQTTSANLSSATTTYPLYLYGAIVARELGALGTITAVTGATTAGYSKSFTYDPRLATSQPPFALSQVRGRWIRLAATTVSPFTPGISGIATTTTVSNSAPTVSFSVPTTPTVSRTLSYTVTFSERISSLASSDFTNTGTASSCTFSIPNSYGITFTLTVVCSSDGTVIVQLAANSVIDNLGLTGPVSASIASTVTISSVATALAMETQPVGGESPTTFATDPKIKLVNSSGDLVTTTGTTITVTASGGTLTGTTSMTTTSGYAEFTNLTLTASAGTYTLTFASSGLTSVTSASVTITVTAAAVTAPTSTCVTTSATTALSGISVGGLASGSTYLVSVALVNAPTGGNLQITSNSGVTAKTGYSVAINTNFTSTVFTGTLANVNAVLATLRYVGGSANVSSTSVKVTASLENASYYLNAFNGHFYYLNTNTLTYTTATTGARDAAKALSYQGQTGYVATITSTLENSFISSNIASATNIWIGATDDQVEGTWKWDASGGSPEAGKQFWTGKSLTSSPVGSKYTADGIDFAGWATGEPNDYNGAEDYAVTNYSGSSGTWNDFPSAGPYQSVVEFGTNAADNGFATGATTYSYANITLCGSATKLSLTTSAVGSVSGATFATQPVVTIQDVSSNTVTNSTATVTAAITAGAGGTLSGTTNATAVSGIATFSNLGITGTLNTSYTITYSSSGLTSATQTITPTSTACTPTSSTSGGYTTLSFTSTGTCTWVVPTGVTTVQTLVVGAGGGGGSGGCNWSYGRGGGGGGVTQTSSTAVTAATNVTVVVGLGGTVATARSGCLGTPGVLVVGTQGGTSSFASISSTGGFSSPQFDTLGGASGVGDNISYAASGLDTADNEGCVPGAGDCAGGGGGGAGGAAGQMSGGTAGNWSTVNGRAGTGGPGVLSSISGTSLAYGAGAFGVTGGTFGTNYGCGGYGNFTDASYLGGGCYNGTAVVNPLANRGGGGLEVNGGSGVVIIKYLTP
ncbi:MAG: lectin-like protein [Actinobacteria bacterium]|nr:lectin-like protein [Actinomycetota bacterium]